MKTAIALEVGEATYRLAADIDGRGDFAHFELLECDALIEIDYVRRQAKPIEDDLGSAGGS